MEWDVLNAKFREVREALNKPETPETIPAYLLCWKKPWKFYREHTVQEAIEILIKEAGAHNNV